MSKVDHPAHYQREGRKECIVEMQEIFGIKETMAFCKLNAFKYKYRAGAKEGSAAVEDFQKAKWYEDYLEKLEEMLPSEKGVTAQQRRRKYGYCVSCGFRRAIEGHRMCEKCAQKERERNKYNYQKLK